MRPAWPEDTIFRRLVLDVERRLLRALQRQVKASVAAEGIGLQNAAIRTFVGSSDLSALGSSASARMLM
jgi:hypothetical protein